MNISSKRQPMLSQQRGSNQQPHLLNLGGSAGSSNLQHSSMAALPNMIERQGHGYGSHNFIIPHKKMDSPPPYSRFSQVNIMPPVAQFSRPPLVGPKRQSNILFSNNLVSFEQLKHQPDGLQSGKSLFPNNPQTTVNSTSAGYQIMPDGGRFMANNLLKGTVAAATTGTTSVNDLSRDNLAGLASNLRNDKPLQSRRAQRNNLNGFQVATQTSAATMPPHYSHSTQVSTSHIQQRQQRLEMELDKYDQEVQARVRQQSTRIHPSVFRQTGADGATTRCVKAAGSSSKLDMFTGSAGRPIERFEDTRGYKGGRTENSSPIGLRGTVHVISSRGEEVAMRTPQPPLLKYAPTTGGRERLSVMLFANQSNQQERATLNPEHQHVQQQQQQQSSRLTRHALMSQKLLQAEENRHLKKHSHRYMGVEGRNQSQMLLHSEPTQMIFSTPQKQMKQEKPDFSWQEATLSRPGIISTDVTEMLITQNKKHFAEKHHQIFASKRKIGSLQEYVQAREGGSDQNSTRSPQRSVSPEEFEKMRHKGNVVLIQKNAISKQTMDLPSRRVAMPALPIDRTIDTLFKDRLNPDRQNAEVAYREREDLQKFPSRRHMKVSNSMQGSKILDLIDERSPHEMSPEPPEQHTSGHRRIFDTQNEEQQQLLFTNQQNFSAYR